MIGSEQVYIVSDWLCVGVGERVLAKSQYYSDSWCNIPASKKLPDVSAELERGQHSLPVLRAAPAGWPVCLGLSYYRAAGIHHLLGSCRVRKIEASFWLNHKLGH